MHKLRKSCIFKNFFSKCKISPIIFAYIFFAKIWAVWINKKFNDIIVNH